MNIPGILTIEKIEADLTSFPVLKMNQSIQIEDYLSDELTKVDLITDTSGIQITPQKTNAGLYYEVEIAFTIAGYDSDIISDLNFSARKPHIYVVTEKSGLKYLIGFTTNPVKFNYELKNDPDGKGGRSALCKITWQTTVFPVFVDT